MNPCIPSRYLLHPQRQYETGKRNQFGSRNDMHDDLRVLLHRDDKILDFCGQISGKHGVNDQAGAKEGVDERDGECHFTSALYLSSLTYETHGGSIERIYPHRECSGCPDWQGGLAKCAEWPVWVSRRAMWDYKQGCWRPQWRECKWR